MVEFIIPGQICEAGLVQFLALILISAIRREMRTAKLSERYTVQELLQEMETLTMVKYSGKYGQILTEVTKAQWEIIKVLDIHLPNKA
jgi:transposase